VIHRLSLSAAFGAFLLVGLPMAAIAQGGDVASETARERERATLYKEGVTLAESGRWEDALARFERVVAIRSAPRALIALATAEEKSGKWIRAKRTYAKTETDARASGESDLAAEATRALRGLDSRMPRVTIQLAPALADARVTLDGSAVDARGGPIETDPGEHRILVQPPSSPTLERSFRASVGATENVVFEPASNGPRPVPVDVFSAEKGPTTRTPGPPVPTWILGGVGVAAMTVGLVVRLNGQAEYDEVDAACREKLCTSREAVDRGNDARGRMLTGSVLMGLGAATVAGAGVWWAVSASRSQRTGRPDAWRIELNATF
jgi:hypothetical protein